MLFLAVGPIALVQREEEEVAENGQQRLQERVAVADARHLGKHVGVHQASTTAVLQKRV